MSGWRAVCHVTLESDIVMVWPPSPNIDHQPLLISRCQIIIVTFTQWLETFPNTPHTEQGWLRRHITIFTTSKIQRDVQVSGKGESWFCCTALHCTVQRCKHSYIQTSNTETAMICGQCILALDAASSLRCHNNAILSYWIWRQHLTANKEKW